MRIQVNGESREVADDITIAALLDLLGVTGDHLAVEHNRSLVARVDFESTVLSAEDAIEIVQFVGGG